jgi:K+-transporting ATPase ATPase B chain
MSTLSRAGGSLLTWPILQRAIVDACRGLDPRRLMRNPVIFVTEIVAALVTLIMVRDLFAGQPVAFNAQLALWLWLTVLFSTFAESLAESRGKAQADALRAMRTDVRGKRLVMANNREIFELVRASELRAGEFVLVETGDVIPADGDVVEGVASVNEAAVTGESAAVIRESGGDRSAVTGGTTVLSDWIVVKVTSEPGSTFVDRMIALVEGASRQKTPNEIALTVMLAGLTLIFLVTVVTLPGLAGYFGISLAVPVLVALLVTLIPTTIGGLLAAIGIAGMDRLLKFNVLATSGRAVEAAGDVDTLLLDKTGTITYGGRLASEIVPVPGVNEREAVDGAVLASLADETPEGRSILAFAREHFSLEMTVPTGAQFIAFSATTRLSGVEVGGRRLRKGAVDAVIKFAVQSGMPAAGGVPASFTAAVDRIARSGGTPLALADGPRLLGVIHLKDTVKPDIKERFAELRRMGIRTVMVTGDNPVTAATVASEAGVDDFIAEATPQAKLDYIRAEQGRGRLVAMCGDGTNDAPALAQADVGVAMQTGTQAAREAGNMVDLDSDPTKLIEVVGIGKQMLMTRGALTTFSIANDVAKYFAIIPALFVGTLPALATLNIMGLASPKSAILSAIIFNALIIVALVPLALRGVAYRPVGAAALLRRNLFVYGLGGLVAPFVGIKLIDLLIAAIGLA